MTTSDSSIKQMLDDYFKEEDIQSQHGNQMTLKDIQKNHDVNEYNKYMTDLLKETEVNYSSEFNDLLLEVTLSLRKGCDYVRLMIKGKNDELLLALFTRITLDKEEEFNEDYEEAMFILTDYLLTNVDLIFKYLQNVSEKRIYQLYPVFSLLLHHFSKTGKISEALTLSHYMRYNQMEISTCSINNIIDAYCKLEQLEEAQKFFSEMCDYTPSLTLPSETLFSFKKYIIGSGVNIVTYGLFIKWLSKKNHMDLAMYYYQALKDKDMLKDEIIFNVLIDACAKSGDIQSLKKLYYDMLNFSIKPTIITFNTIIDAYIRIKDLHSAWKIYADLIQNDIKPDNFTLSNLFRGIRLPCHKEFLDKAIEIIKSFTVKEKNDDGKADTILINVLLDSCIAIKDSKLLCELFNDIVNGIFTGVQPDIITFNTFIKGCAQMGLIDQVTEAFQTLCSNSDKNNLHPNDVTFNTLIDVYVRNGNMKEVWYLIAKMKELNIKPDNFTYSTIIKGLNKNTNLNLSENSTNQHESELDLAFKLFDNVKKNSQPDEILYNCIMDACLRFDQIDKMLELYDNMLSEGVKPSSITCGIAIKAYGMKGNLNKALEVYKEMKTEKIEISSVTYGCLINACIKNGNMEKAFALYEDLLSKGYEMNTILYTTLIKAYTKTKDLGKVLEIFYQMKQTSNSHPNNITYNSVIDCSIKAGQFTKANDIFEEMCQETSFVQPDIITFSTLIKGAFKQGDFDTSLKYYEKMKKFNVTPDEVLLNSLLDGCDKCKKYSQAIELFNNVKSYGIEPTMMSYSIMMKMLGRLNDFENSKKLLNELLKKNKNLSLILFTCFIKTCIYTQEIDYGISTFFDLKKYNLEPDEIAFNTMINGITSSDTNKNYSADLCKIIVQSVDMNIVLQRYNYISILKYLKSWKMYDKATEMGKYFEDNEIIEPRKNKYENGKGKKQYQPQVYVQRQSNQKATHEPERQPLGQIKDYTKNTNAETGNNYEITKKYDENSKLYSFNNNLNSNTMKGNNAIYSTGKGNHYHKYNVFNNDSSSSTPINDTQHDIIQPVNQQKHNGPQKKKFSRF